MMVLFINIIWLLIGLFISAFIIRFHVNAYRLGYNPVVDKLNQLTAPVVLPFRQFLPDGRYELSALAPPIIVSVLMGYVFVHNLIGGFFYGIIALFLATWLQVIFYAIMIIVIGSWLQTDPRQPIMQIVLSCADWFISPLRRIIPPIGMFDFTPIVALIILQLAQQGLEYLRLLLG